MAARPPANSPPVAVVSAPAAPATVQSLGEQLRELLPARRLHSVSVWDAEANVLWLSEGALGPDEQTVVVEAIEALASEPSLACHENTLEDGRQALFLAVRAPTGQVVGTAMILADCKSAGDDTQERLTIAPVRTIMQRLAVLLKPGHKAPHGLARGARSPDSPQGGMPVIEFVPVIEPAPAAHARRSDAAGAAAPVKPVPARPHAPSPPAITPEEVNDLLEFELPAGTVPPIARPTNGSAVDSAVDGPSDRVSPELVAGESPALGPAAIVPQPRSDAALALEVLAYGKLRPGGQLRRFQIQPRFSPRVAQADPAALDVLILQRLVGWLAAHRTAWNSQPTSFTVSVSIAALEDDHFAQKVASELNAHGIGAETVGFEITEAMCTQRRAQVERFIAHCDKLGAHVVIDDFSFDSQVMPLLRSKAVRLLKIDPKLSSSALKDKLSQALVVASVQAAKVLGIHCSAKQVDTQAAAQWLAAIGCEFGQGAAFSKAQPLESLGASPDATGLTALIARHSIKPQKA